MENKSNFLSFLEVLKSYLPLRRRQSLVLLSFPFPSLELDGDHVVRSPDVAVTGWGFALAIGK